MLSAPNAEASDLALNVQRAEAASWKAEGIKLQISPPSGLILEIARVVVAGKPPLRELSLRCDHLIAGSGARCDDARFAIKIPGWGRIKGRAQLRFINAQNWQAQLQVPQRGLRLHLAQAGSTMTASVDLRGQPASDLQLLAAALGVILPGKISGLVDLDASANLGTATVVHAKLKLQDLSYGEDSGRYATEKLNATAELHYESARSRWQLAMEAREGQAYVEPLFLDFSVQPMQLALDASAMPFGWNLSSLRVTTSDAGSVEASGRLDSTFKPMELQARYQAQELAPLVASFVQPFLIGTALEGLELRGRSSGRMSYQEGAVESVSATLEDVSFAAAKLGLMLDQIVGEITWSARDSQPSKLHWRSGSMQSVPFGESKIAFRTQGRDFQLLAPWRQPLLKGALKVEKLALRDIGGAQLDADFQGELEPIDLTALCKALDWPQFGGTFGGQLPGLRVRDDVWTFAGALQAQAFDGSLRIENLRAIQPFGVLPRVTADLQMRRLDLEQLTSAFSFGRITGRLDGDVRGLRLLSWKPVAFDARIYSTPGDDSSHRISQRAIDNISAIGGGPTGVLSRGFLSFFKEFQYAKLGLSCVLRDGVCLMGGVESAPAGEGEQQGYYLVKGRLLPRIDVRGYATRVSWNNLIDQLNAARKSSGPQLK